MERIQKFSDPPLTVCPHCGGELEQLLSAPAVQFKGAGWYVTDYARKGSSGGSKEGGSKEGKSGGDSDGKSSSASGSSSSESSGASKSESSTSKENK
jgi:putative FmdB family regulatory protein